MARIVYVIDPGVAWKNVYDLNSKARAWFPSYKANFTGIWQATSLQRRPAMEINDILSFDFMDPPSPLSFFYGKVSSILLLSQYTGLQLSMFWLYLDDNSGGFALKVKKENPNAESKDILWFILYFNKLLFKLFLSFKNIKMMFFFLNKQYGLWLIILSHYRNTLQGKENYNG